VSKCLPKIGQKFWGGARQKGQWFLIGLEIEEGRKRRSATSLALKEENAEIRKRAADGGVDHLATLRSRGPKSWRGGKYVAVRQGPVQKKKSDDGKANLPIKKFLHE